MLSGYSDNLFPKKGLAKFNPRETKTQAELHWQANRQYGIRYPLRQAW